ncbi:MAG: CDP-diacylglycerol--serine O-phosphatidyltransferase [Ignavibacteriaceae bacterium]
MNRLRITPSVIPNLFTAMNMFCGFLSIINTSKELYHYAAWLIVIAAIFDALDGAMARLTKSSSELGVELDSLSDVVSFGAAPAFLIYSTHLFNDGVAGVIISSLLLIAGGFRLARFNVQLVGFDKAFFKGLPIPGSGIMIAAFVLGFYDPVNGFPQNLDNFIIPLVLILSYLMISKIKYDTFPKISLAGLKQKPVFILVVVLAVVLLFLTTIEKTVFYLFVFIIVFGIFKHIFNYFFKKSRSKE